MAAASSAPPAPVVNGTGCWRIVIDDRERRREQLLMQIAAYQKRVSICRLSRGDYAFVGPDNTLRAAFELKTDSDMASSIIGSNRYREQARGMCDDLKDVPFKGYIHVHQDRELFIPPSMQASCSQKDMRSRIANAFLHIQASLGLHVIHVQSEEDLAPRLVRLMNYLEEEEDRFHAPDVDQALALSGKKRFKTQKVVWLQQLRCIDKVSATVATSIAARYASAPLLIDAFKACASKPEQMLIGIPNGKKKIGKEISKRVYQCIMLVNDESSAASATSESKRQRSKKKEGRVIFEEHDE